MRSATAGGSCAGRSAATRCRASSTASRSARVRPITGDGARNLAWLRLHPPCALDHLALTALSDGWMPAAFSKLRRPVGAPTVDLTIHLRAPPAPGERVLAAIRA